MSGLSSRWLQRIAIAMGVSCALATVAHAVPITYTFAGTWSGSLGATTFTDAPFTVTALGDTTQVTSIGPGVPCNNLTGLTFNISGVDSGYITSPLSIAANTGRQLLALASGNCVDSGLIWMSGYDAQIGTYNLATGIGPVSLAFPSEQSGVNPSTSSGALAITSIASMTVQATAGSAIVPAKGLWWNPNESGSGYNLDVKHGVLVVTVFSYKADGEPQ